MAKATVTMDDLLAGDSVKQVTNGEVVTGKVLSVRKHEVLIDLGARVLALCHAVKLALAVS